MVMILDRRIKRTFAANKAPYISSFLLIMVSCLLFTTFILLTENMKVLYDSFKKDYALEDASFTTDKALENIPALESAYQLRLEENAYFDEEIHHGPVLRVFAESESLNRYAVKEGAPLSGDDIVINPAFAKANDIHIGDSIQIRDVIFKVSGLISLPNYIYPLKKESDLLIDESNFGFAVISMSDFARFQSGTRYYSVKGTGNENESVQNLAVFKDAMKDRNISILQWTDSADNPRVMRVTAEIESIETVGAITPIVILILTCVLTAAVLRRMLQREAVMMGTLYATGYSRSELTRHYLKYPILISSSASIVGTVLGAAALRPMLVMMTSNYNMPLDDVHYRISIIVISILLPLLILTVTGYEVVRRGLRSTPVELIRGGSEKRKIGWLESKVKLGSLSFATKFKVREQLRSIPRSLFLLLGVALATMLLLFGFTIQSSLDSMMKVDSVYKYEHEYLFKSFQQGTAQGDPFSMASFQEKSGGGKGLTVYGVGPGTKSIYLEDEWGLPLTFDSVIATKPLANRFKLKPGDTMELKGKLDAGTYMVTIDHIADSYNGEFLYMPLADFNEMLHYPENSYLGIWSTGPIDVSENELVSASTIGDIQKAYNSFSQRLQAVLGMTSVISFLIGLIVIFVVTSLIIEENRDSISLMKVLGYSKKEVNRLILNSSSYLVLLGFVVGIPLLLLSLSALFQSVAESSNFILRVHLNIVYILIGFVIVYSMFALTKMVSRRKIQKISLGEALKTRLE